MQGNACSLLGLSPGHKRHDGIVFNKTRLNFRDISSVASYWTELATCENTVLELLPIRRTVPTTIIKMTATMTAYSAIS